jgi:hypothetical protein
VHNALQAELAATSQHSQLIGHPAYNVKLYIDATRNRLQNIKQHVAHCVNIALEELEPAGQDSHYQPWHVPEMSRLQCPWTPRSLSKSQLG